MTRSGFVAVVGLPNAGKSTLINALLQDKLLITSEKRQTTRKSVRCILTGSDFQIVLVDTPGIHDPKNKLGEFMRKEVETIVRDADIILYILDGTGEAVMPDLVVGKLLVVAVNKIDLLAAAAVEAVVARLEADPRTTKVVPISAVLGTNLDRLVKELVDLLPPGPFFYPEDQLVDADYRFLVAELIREQALRHLEDEVPHGIAVDIEEFREGEAEVTIAASIIVEKESHKGIVIGRGGAMLKKVGTASRQQIQGLLDKGVHLKLWVKVRKNWRKDPNQLKWLGYK